MKKVHFQLTCVAQKCLCLSYVISHLTLLSHVTHVSTFHVPKWRACSQAFGDLFTNSGLHGHCWGLALLTGASFFLTHTHIHSRHSKFKETLILLNNFDWCVNPNNYK